MRRMELQSIRETAEGRQRLARTRVGALSCIETPRRGVSRKRRRLRLGGQRNRLSDIHTSTISPSDGPKIASSASTSSGVGLKQISPGPTSTLGLVRRFGFTFTRRCFFVGALRPFRALDIRFRSFPRSHSRSALRCPDAPRNRGRSCSPCVCSCLRRAPRSFDARPRFCLFIQPARERLARNYPAPPRSESGEV